MTLKESLNGDGMNSTINSQTNNHLLS